MFDTLFDTVTLFASIILKMFMIFTILTIHVPKFLTHVFGFAFVWTGLVPGSRYQKKTSYRFVTVRTRRHHSFA